MARTRGWSVLWTLTLVCATLLLTTGVAFGSSERHPHVGRLPGYPAIRGVVPVIGSKTAISARGRLIKDAFGSVRSQRRAIEANPGAPACPEKFVFSQDVCYQGGPVLRGVKVHLIFWLGPNDELAPLTPKVRAFPNSYRLTIARYFGDVAHDHGLENDVYAVDPQYKDKTGSGVNEISFNEANQYLDEKVFPTNTPAACTDATTSSEGPCLLDSDVQKEVENAITANGWETGLGNIYFVFTAPGVGSCAEFGCAYQAYCAYHGDFGGEGVFPSSGQTIYANMPYAAPKVCDSGVHPNELADEGTDGAIDVASHELNESITDPLGSQCKSFAKHECEPFSWTDAIGQEIGDKCLPPEATIAGTYGEPLIELGAFSFNQLINGDEYWTQREWSNEAGLGEGACVQRRIEARFSISVSRKATVPMTLDGSASGAPGDPAVYWVWNFGGGEQIGTASSTISHTFAQPGSYAVGLAAYDAYGNSEAGVGDFDVGAAPVTPPAPIPLVLKEVSVSKRLSAAQVASKVGLPVNGKNLSGRGPFSFGHAECPPACGLTLQLFAKRTSTVNKHRTTKLVLIGSTHFVLTVKGVRTVSLALNAKGMQLLHKLHHLACKLVANVEGQEGGSWQITRSLVLKG
jgi:hypothetical protein